MEKYEIKCNICHQRIFIISTYVFWDSYTSQINIYYGLKQVLLLLFPCSGANVALFIANVFENRVLIIRRELKHISFNTKLIKNNFDWPRFAVPNHGLR